jgi:hypothetical protein
MFRGMPRPEARPMPRIGSVPPDVRTVHLGAFTYEHADRLGCALDHAGIVWWVKVPGFFTGIWEREVHVFVDRERAEQARELAKGITSR